MAVIFAHSPGTAAWRSNRCDSAFRLRRRQVPRRPRLSPTRQATAPPPAGSIRDPRAGRPWRGAREPAPSAQRLARRRDGRARFRLAPLEPPQAFAVTVTGNARRHPDALRFRAAGSDNPRELEGTANGNHPVPVLVSHLTVGPTLRRAIAPRPPGVAGGRRTAQPGRTVTGAGHWATSAPGLYALSRLGRAGRWWRLR